MYYICVCVFGGVIEKGQVRLYTYNSDRVVKDPVTTTVTHQPYNHTVTNTTPHSHRRVTLLRNQRPSAGIMNGILQKQRLNKSGNLSTNPVPIGKLGSLV